MVLCRSIFKMLGQVNNTLGQKYIELGQEKKATCPRKSGLTVLETQFRVVGASRKAYIKYKKHLFHA